MKFGKISRHSDRSSINMNRIPKEDNQSGYPAVSCILLAERDFATPCSTAQPTASDLKQNDLHTDLVVRVRDTVG